MPLSRESRNRLTPWLGIAGLALIVAPLVFEPTVRGNAWFVACLSFMGAAIAVGMAKPTQPKYGGLILLLMALSLGSGWAGSHGVEPSFQSAYLPPLVAMEVALFLAAGIPLPERVEKSQALNLSDESRL